MNHESASKRTEEEFLLRERAIRRVLSSQGHSEEILKELVQETFLRLFSELLKGREPNNPGAWLITVALNLGRDYFQLADVKAKKLHFIEDEEENSPESSNGFVVRAADFPSKLTNPDVLDGGLLNEDCVFKKLIVFKSEKPKRALAIELIRDGYTAAEIANQLGKSIDATYVFISESRKLAMQYFSECVE